MREVVEREEAEATLLSSERFLRADRVVICGEVWGEDGASSLGGGSFFFADLAMVGDVMWIGNCLRGG